MKNITILGAGAMGSALTTPLTRNGHEVRLWATEFDTALLAALRAGELHPRIGVACGSQVLLYDSFALEEALTDADVIVLAITSDGVVPILQRAAPYLHSGQPLVMVSKGFGQTLSGRVSLLPPLLQDALPSHLRETCPIIVVGGPCKANEVGAGWPTATVYASQHAEALSSCQSLFQTPQYRIHTTDDVAGLELAAALKNVYAIALGMCNGLEEVSQHPWHNLKAALFAQAIAEMARLAEAMGGRAETVQGLAGAGDLEVTALSGRNRLLGERIGRGEPIQHALAAMHRAEQTVEGVAAAYFALALVAQLAQEQYLPERNFPLLYAIHALLEGATHVVELLTEAALPPMSMWMTAPQMTTRVRVQHDGNQRYT